MADWRTNYYVHVLLVSSLCHCFFPLLFGWGHFFRTRNATFTLFSFYPKVLPSATLEIFSLPKDTATGSTIRIAEQSTLSKFPNQNLF
ncbi:hypothetical protein LOK49_LG02G00584 [Camellia lanceoleosa]|uniref:Uncharacterized protein n=1 Tax=Camellia lanceoleosa TaxID=1840588 RepID=A0ACC0IKW2_9ERIC|nr:hypothetical protein LOK49_LG02G00584 [Camellia lanceoleosa]